MKKIFFLFVVAMVAASVMAFQPSIKPMMPVSKALNAAPTSLLPAYNGTCYSFDNTNNWQAYGPWTVTPGVYSYQGTNYDVIYDVLPNELFTDSLSYMYVIQEGNLLFPATPWAQYNDSLYVVSMDYTDFSNGGSGMIALQLGSDGSLSVPEACAQHVYGFFACTINEQYQPIEVYGAFAQYAGLQYEPMTTALPNVEETGKAVKQMVNGQVLIERNGQYYTISGTHVK